VELLSSFNYQGVSHAAGRDAGGDPRLPGADPAAYKSCVVVFACMDVRAKLFSEARFQWRNTSKKLFGTPELAILETPWPGGTTGDLLYRMLQMVDLSGNAFVARRPTGCRCSGRTGGCGGGFTNSDASVTSMRR
jgi:hypothetical protein